MHQRGPPVAVSRRAGAEGLERGRQADEHQRLGVDAVDGCVRDVPGDLGLPVQGQPGDDHAHDNPDTAKETITLVIKTKDGQPIATYAMQMALVKSVTPPKPDAGGSGFLTSTITIHGEDVQIS